MTKFTGFKEALKQRNGMDKWRTWSEPSHRFRIGGCPSTLGIFQRFALNAAYPNADQMHVVTARLAEGGG